MADIITVPNFKMLNGLPSTPQEGEVAFCEEEHQYYVFHEKWVPVEASMTEDGLKLNLYDLNKQIVSQLEDFDDEHINELKTVIKDWKANREDKYLLLYGKEIGYFTLFTQGDNGSNVFEDELIACLNDFESIKTYDVNDQAIEIWVKYEEETTVLYLFGYDAGVIEYNG